jgi:P27 family predicted phage terminase small subunit
MAGGYWKECIDPPGGNWFSGVVQRLTIGNPFTRKSQPSDNFVKEIYVKEVIDVKTPAHLSPGMRKFFKKIMEDFDLESHHVVILTRACETFDMAEKARRQVALEGLTVTTRTGGPKQHPAVRIELEATNCARLLLRELGLDLEPAGEVGCPPRQY